MAKVLFDQNFRSDASDVLIRCLDGVENFAALMDRLVRERPFSIDFSQLITQSPGERFGQLLLFIRAIYVAKFQELLFACVESANEKRFLVFALCGRAVIESTATLRYYCQKLEQQIKSAKDPNAFDEDEIKTILDVLSQHSTGGRFDWLMFWHGDRTEMVEKLADVKAGKATHTQPNQSQVNVVTTIDKWAKAEPAVRLAYDFFCELVHPNVGSNFLLMDSSGTMLRVGPDGEKDLGESLAVEGVQFLAPCLREASDCLMKIIGWGGVATKGTEFKT